GFPEGRHRGRAQPGAASAPRSRAPQCRAYPAERARLRADRPQGGAGDVVRADQCGIRRRAFAPLARAAAKSNPLMNDKNTIIAIVLSALVLIGWQYFIGGPQMERAKQETLLKQQQQAQQAPTPGSAT